MEFVNHTPFPAQPFLGVTLEGEEFHVVVLRQTLTWGKDEQLFFSEDQLPLCEADEPFNPEQPGGEVRQESDLCQYKPRCDIIVNAHAYPPKLTQSFEIRLRVETPDTLMPLPPEPRGLNPLTGPSREQMAAWEAAVKRAKQTVLPGERLIDKTLRVTGERYLIRRLGGWVLSEAQPVLEPVPVRLLQAFGGECRVEAGTRAAEKVSQRHWLTLEQAQTHPDDPPPIAHDALDANLVGCGFVRQWFLDAAQPPKLAAPRIESPSRPFGISEFNRICADRLEDAATLVAGLGVRPKGHPDRAKLVGTIDEAFIKGDIPLPSDFDFAVWNAAWPDQQVEALAGDEIIELTNLCSSDTVGVVQEKGNSVLRLKLPGHLPFVLVRFEEGVIGELEAWLDTVIINPEAEQVSLVWRTTASTQPPIRVLEARMISREARKAFEQALSKEAAHG
jgi:hypothetical protein